MGHKNKESHLVIVISIFEGELLGICLIDDEESNPCTVLSWQNNLKEKYELH